MCPYSRAWEGSGSYIVDVPLPSVPVRPVSPGVGSCGSFLIMLPLIGEDLTSVIGQKPVVFPCFSPAVVLKIEAAARFSLIEFVRSLKQSSCCRFLYLCFPLFEASHRVPLSGTKTAISFWNTLYLQPAQMTPLTTFWRPCDTIFKYSST